MYPSPRSHVLPVCLLSLLAACGGGGGGGGPVDVAFLSFSTIGPNQRANMIGISNTASGTVVPGPGGTFSIGSVSIAPLDTANTRAQLTYDGSRNLSAMSFTAPQSSADFSSGIACSTGAIAAPVCTADTATSVGVLGNPSFHAWNYQTYGVWLSRPTSTTFQAGALSAGATTPASAMPTMGTAIFTGFTSGFYVDSAGTPYFTSANVNANVDFGATPRTVAFSTTNTFIGNLSTGAAPIPQPDLNLNGALTYPAGSNQFSGNVTATPAIPLAGTATGRFYGPAAQEMGGVYNLTGTGGSLIGAFGARRP